MNFKGSSYTVLIFWIIFLGNASSSYATGSATKSIDCDGTKIIIPKQGAIFSLRENNSFQYKINFNKIITAATCSNEVTNASLKFRYTDGTNNFGVQSTLVASKESAGKWNCKVWMTGNCILEFYFQLKVIHFHIKTSIEDTYNSTIQVSWSEAIITAKGDNFWIQFTSDFPIASASCHDVNGNGQLCLNYIDSSSKKSINSYLRAASNVKGPWNCSFDDELGVRKFVIVKVIWKPSTLSTPTTTQLSTTTQRTTTKIVNGKCAPNQFKCNNNKCIHKMWLCDSDDDCGDGSDEVDCDHMLPRQCRATMFTCTSQTQCVPMSLYCNGFPDCDDRSDEVGCATPDLSSSTHRGDGGAPIALTKSTTEAAQNIDDEDVSLPSPTPTWLIIGAVVATLICSILVIVGIVVYCRKTQIPTPAPQPEAPRRIEQSVYYTIHGDDFNEEYSYAYAYARQEPLRTNVACNDLYDTVGDN